MKRPIDVRIGVDLGGTKIEAIALGPQNAVLAGPHRVATPRHDYDATVRAICDVVGHIKQNVADACAAPAIGLGIPGSLAANTGVVQNANSVWLNGRALGHDLALALEQPVRLANDANCFTLSEARDGAGAQMDVVFGVILGTGVGGGLTINGHLLQGALGIAGEWGHNPLANPVTSELPGPACWCGRHGCYETWLSGPALAAQYRSASGQQLEAADLPKAALSGDHTARKVLDDHADRLARGLAGVINIVDPDVVVLGGGLSKLTHLYDVVPDLVRHHLFTDHPDIDIRPARWGDSSGVRGAAWLWDEDMPV